MNNLYQDHLRLRSFHGKEAKANKKGAQECLPLPRRIRRFGI
jgi:hypothetical protein